MYLQLQYIEHHSHVIQSLYLENWSHFGGQCVSSSRFRVNEPLWESHSSFEWEEMETKTSRKHVTDSNRVKASDDDDEIWRNDFVMKVSLLKPSCWNAGDDLLPREKLGIKVTQPSDVYWLCPARLWEQNATFIFINSFSVPCCISNKDIANNRTLSQLPLVCFFSFLFIVRLWESKWESLFNFTDDKEENNSAGRVFNMFSSR